MSLKKDNFRFYWAAVTEHTFKQCLCKGIIPFRWNTKRLIGLFSGLRYL